MYSALALFLLGGATFLVLAANFASYLAFYDDKPPRYDLMKTRMRLASPNVSEDLGNGGRLTTDGRGFRKPRWHQTHLPAASADNTVIWIFGGSTTYSTGVDDDNTLPAKLERALPPEWKPYVVNFGQSNYRMHQEVYLLVDALIGGHRPDYVVFYDGFNEGSGFKVQIKTGKAEPFSEIDVGWNAVHTAYDEFARQSAKRFWWIDHWPMMRSVQSLQKKLHGGADDYWRPPRVHVDQFTQAVTDRYFQSLAFVDRLSKAYGFHYVAFWQPSGAFLSDKNCYVDPPASATDFYRGTYWQELGRVFRILYPKVLARAEQEHRPLIYIGDAFNAGQCKDASYFTDYVHLNAEGNRVAAERIADLLQAFRAQGHIIGDRRAWALPKDDNLAAR